MEPDRALDVRSPGRQPGRASDSPPELPLASASWATTFLAAVAVALASLLLLIATSADTGMVSARPPRCAAGGSFRNGSRTCFAPAAAGSPDRPSQRGPGTVVAVQPRGAGRPSALYALIGLAGWWLTHVAPAPADGLSLRPDGALRRRRSASSSITWPGVADGSRARRPPRSCCSCPLFALGHYAHYDMPMTCLWLLAQVAFINSLRSPGLGRAVRDGARARGGHQVHGVFAVVPAVAWVVWSRSAPALSRLRPGSEVGTAHAFAGPRAAGMGPADRGDDALAIQPPWWVEPDRRGVESYLRRT